MTGFAQKTTPALEAEGIEVHLIPSARPDQTEGRCELATVRIICYRVKGQAEVVCGTAGPRYWKDAREWPAVEIVALSPECCLFSDRAKAARDCPLKTLLSNKLPHLFHRIPKARVQT